ncbi:hypothetical protein JGS22_015035 [Streptomyces sp. P38-E01]|uniref:Uncharacterized protein n=1 Tax=Streptomyces tardus TaxID=2780544 RepID=A0A949N9G5_9ACTN|nr:DUF6238 family protein [Streptomyces tardus]MBU7598893.1 hypothetical protein [Streptomyces tardus]
MTTTRPADAHPYLRAASAGVRHHSRAADAPADRTHLDVLHDHLTLLHQLLDRLATASRPPHPNAGRHLAAAHARLWQAAESVHTAFHLLPPVHNPHIRPACKADQLHDGPAVLTICQRHLAGSHAVRRKTTPAQLSR